LTVFDLFSKRQKRLRGEVPDVYVYDKIPQALRVQVVHIWHDALGTPVEYREGYNGVHGGYKFLVETLCREYGVFKLPPASGYSDRDYSLAPEFRWTPLCGA
jgi:hypothetical protein